MLRGWTNSSALIKFGGSSDLRIWRVFTQSRMAALALARFLTMPPNPEGPFLSESTPEISGIG